jgi:hypothetical protein
MDGYANADFTDYMAAAEHLQSVQCGFKPCHMQQCGEYNIAEQLSCHRYHLFHDSC